MLSYAPDSDRLFVGFVEFTTAGGGGFYLLSGRFSFLAARVCGKTRNYREREVFKVGNCSATTRSRNL